MGAYLSKPITEKISSDESSENLYCGASSMQGWRVYQEDAHNTCLNFDKNRALFAVYDGHGGSEVATYSASELPDFIKNVEAYKKEQFSQALVDAFLEFDATLVKNNVQGVLKELAGRKDQEDEDSDYDGEEVDHLCREASMPLEEVMAKYSQDSSSGHFQSPCLRPKIKVGCMSSSVGCSSSYLVDEFDDASDIEPAANTSLDSSCCSHFNESASFISSEGETPVVKSPDASPVHSCPHIEEASSSLCNGTSSVQLQKDVVEKADEESNSTELGKQELSKIDRLENKEIISNDIDKKDTYPSITIEILPKQSKEELSPKQINEEIVSKADKKKLSSPKDIKEELSPNSDKENISDDNSTSMNGDRGAPLVNGKIKDEGGGHMECENTKEEKKSCNSSSSEKMELEIENGETKSKDLNGEMPQKLDSPKGKGKGGKAKGKGLLSNAMVQAMRTVKQSEKRRKAAVIAEQIYRQIKGGREDSSSEDEDTDDDDGNFENEGCCHQLEDSSSEENENEDDDDDDDDDEIDDDDDDDEPQEGVHYTEFPMNMKEEPGYDSGCTACVAFLNGTELYVANVGDSRCVVCRNGKALDMSVDHKPEDEPEAARIRQAGGRITGDGRVNGGLNLSRALGDHSYKQNKAQRPEAQMISPLPDVRSLTLTPDDTFMVIACDGIWNSMSSQDVVDFVNEKLESHPKMSKIAEEMFDFCLSPDAHGDGTGCDNMTCIIIKFKSQFLSNSDGGKRACDASELNTDELIDPQEKRCRLEAE